MYMKWIAIVLSIVIITGCYIESQESGELTDEETKVIGGVNMKINSTEFQNGGDIPSKFTCTGEDINPSLSWKDAPAETKSFALIVDDPDAPGGVWVHWLVKDIPASASEIPENTVPGTQVVNDFGKVGYGGPCPPSGVHRYFFKIIALDVPTFQAENKIEFYEKVKAHKLAEAWIMGKFSKG